MTQQSKDKIVEDTLNTSVFASAIAEFIQSCDTPMTIGIQGDWGSGKTSLINMISSHLTKNKQIKEINLNTWQYSLFKQDEYLGLAVINALLEKIQILFGIEKQNALIDSTVKKLKRFVNLLSRVEISIPLTPISITGADAYEALKNKDNKELDFENISMLLEEFKNAFIEIVDTQLLTDERLVFYIDDLDRVKPVKAIEVLEAIKLFMDIDKCVFVLAVDYEVVQLGITEKFGKDIQQSSGKSFFDKIIQLPFNMPTSSYEIETYISTLLKNSEIYKYKFDSNPKDVDFFVDITEVTVGRNPRSIKRAINYASLLERIRAKQASIDEKKERNTIKLLYAIVCMQISWPELFDYFLLHPTPETIKNLEDWDFLQNLPQARKMFARIHNSNEVQDNISAYFDTIYEILDTGDKDGIIDSKELQPLLEVLKLVKLTSEKHIAKSENPLKIFEKKLLVNCERNKEIFDFFQEVFLRSYWSTHDNIEYKKAGERYFSIVYCRRQLGSITSLKTRPFFMRLKITRNAMLSLLEGFPDFETISSVIKAVENPSSGIGDTEIDCALLAQQQNNEKSKDTLNRIFDKFISTLKI